MNSGIEVMQKEADRRLREYGLMSYQDYNQYLSPLGISQSDIDKLYVLLMHKFEKILFEELNKQKDD